MRALFLLSCCLLSPLANASFAQGLPRPLAARPPVVLLDSGTVLRRTLVGIDTTMYRAIRLKVERTELLEYGRSLSLLQVGQLQAELRRSRQQVLLGGKDFNALAEVNRKLAALPLAKPLVLDPHTYLGVGLGAALLVGLKLFLLH